MKRFLSIILCLLICTGITPVAISAADPIPAFPGAEGAAQFITGGRGGDVYEVTSLEDTLEPGTLRYGLYKVANNRSKTTVIVFRVSGTIHLNGKIKTDVHNLTIAGQTAPGDGITIGDYSVSLGGSNVIIRHIRFRGGFAQLDDTFSPNGPKMIIDHCSFSWSTDEVLSTKDKSSITVQWSIISNSLNMSIHDKGSHGYGGIWGGTNMTFHHNLIANNNSRNPRLDRDFRLEKDAPLLFELTNNVIYNWGSNSGYGGENATGVNIVNNYYKAGPATFDDVKNRIYNPWSEQPGNYYVEGNYVDGYQAISANNWAGGIQPEYGLGSVNRLDHPVPITYTKDGTVIPTSVTTDSAIDTYDKVLNNAGAILPKRDSLDARIINDVRYGLGKFANTPDGDGGFPSMSNVKYPDDYDKDHDGIPNDWEVAKGLNPDNAADGKADSGDGYTNLENYMNSLVGNGLNNPSVVITSPTANAMINSNNDVVIHASASDSDGTVSKVEFSYYDTKEMKLKPLGEVASAPYTYTWMNAPEGTHYLYAKATDNTGTQTLSSTGIVHVNGTGEIAPWTSKDVGTVKIPGTASAAGDTFTVKGSGEIGASNDGIHSADAFHYMYQEITGDAELISSLSFQNPSEYDNDVKAGLMIRQDLTTDSPFAMMTIMKEHYFGARIHFMTRSEKGGLVDSAIKLIDENKPLLLKITKYSNEVKGYISQDGGSYWEFVGSAELDLSNHAYIGMALDATKSTNNFDYYNTTIFENTKLLKVPQLSINNPESETVYKADYIISGRVSAGTTLSIKKNGVAGDPVKYESDSDFSQSVTLVEGANNLEISVKDANNLTSMKMITVIYDKAWNGDVFKVQLSNSDGDAIRKLMPLQDVSVSGVFKSNSEIDKNVVLVIALIDSENIIVSYSYSNDIVAGLDTKKLNATFKIPQKRSGYKLQAFVWDSIISRKIISNVVSLP